MKRSIICITCLAALFFTLSCSKTDVTAVATATPTPTPAATPTAEISPSPEDLVEAYPLPDDGTILSPAESSAPTGTRRLSLQEATSSNIVDSEIAGTGSSSGDSMLLKVRNLSDSPVDLYIVPGTVLAPTGGNAQQMIAWRFVAVADDENSPATEVTSIYLPDATPKLALIEAYCLNFDRPNPEPRDLFAIQPRPHIVAASVVYAAKEEGLSMESTQIAVWKNEDDHITQQEIHHKFPASQEEFDKAFELVKRVRKTRNSRASVAASFQI
jgi:hypothetical protein